MDADPGDVFRDLECLGNEVGVIAVADGKLDGIDLEGIGVTGAVEARDECILGAPGNRYAVVPESGALGTGEIVHRTLAFGYAVDRLTLVIVATVEEDFIVVRRVRDSRHRLRFAYLIIKGAACAFIYVN